ncbi:MAG: nuclear transport factor 2 family protein [Bradyrhizobium sp.]
MTDKPDHTDNQAAIERNRQAVTRYASAWLAGDHSGKPAALAILAEVTSRTNRKLLGIVDIMAGPERGALLVRERFERDGRIAEFERLLVYAVRDDLLSECWVWDQDQAAVDVYLA